MQLEKPRPAERTGTQCCPGCPLLLVLQLQYALFYIPFFAGYQNEQNAEKKHQAAGFDAA